MWNPLRETEKNGSFVNEKSGRKQPDRKQNKDLSLSVSRVLSCTVIYLGLPSPASSSDIHGICRTDSPIWQTPNLAAGGVYMAYRVTAISVSSYLAFPSLQGESPAVYFCCTFLEVAFTWRYQAPCPVLLGLSSWSRRTPRPYNKLKSLYIIAHLTKKVLLFQQKNSKI